MHQFRLVVHLQVTYLSCSSNLKFLYDDSGIDNLFSLVDDRKKKKKKMIQSIEWSEHINKNSHPNLSF